MKIAKIKIMSEQSTLSVMHMLILIVLSFILAGILGMGYTYGQNNSTMNFTTIQSPPKDIFRVAITLFGVDERTGNVFSFVNVNNLTSGRFYNATSQDADQDGVAEISIGFPNKTIGNGTKFDACNIVLNTLEYKCVQGFNSPSPRTEFAQFSVK